MQASASMARVAAIMMGLFVLSAPSTNAGALYCCRFAMSPLLMKGCFRSVHIQHADGSASPSVAAACVLGAALILLSYQHQHYRTWVDATLKCLRQGLLGFPKCLLLTPSQQWTYRA